MALRESRLLPVPSATQEMASSATMVWMPVRAVISLSKPSTRLPPPVMTIPLSEISATSSGGVRSSTPWTASRIRSTGSSKASSISVEEMVSVLGRPVSRQRPFTSMEVSSSLGNTQPICIFIISAVRSPTSTLCLRRIYLTMASLNWSPATLMEADSTTPLREITAISVVPPPISTTMWPSGLAMSMPAPIAAATGSSIRYTRRAPA